MSRQITPIPRWAEFSCDTSLKTYTQLWWTNFSHFQSGYTSIFQKSLSNFEIFFHSAQPLGQAESWYWCVCLYVCLFVCVCVFVGPPTHNYGSTFEFLVNFWIMGGFLIMGDFWNMGEGGDKHIDTQTDRQTHQYHDSAWPRGRAEWK